MSDPRSSYCEHCGYGPSCSGACRKPKEAVMKAFAFWSYDQFPGCLGGPTEGEIGPGGAVYVPSYQTSVKPMILLSPEEGVAVHEKLKVLKSEYLRAKALLDAQFKIQAHFIAPFLKGRS